MLSIAWFAVDLSSASWYRRSIKSRHMAKVFSVFRCFGCFVRKSDVAETMLAPSLNMTSELKPRVMRNGRSTTKMLSSSFSMYLSALS